MAAPATPAAAAEVSLRPGGDGGISLRPGGLGGGISLRPGGVGGGLSSFAMGSRPQAPSAADTKRLSSEDVIKYSKDFMMAFQERYKDMPVELATSPLEVVINDVNEELAAEEAAAAAAASGGGGGGGGGGAALGAAQADQGAVPALGPRHEVVVRALLQHHGARHAAPARHAPGGVLGPQHDDLVRAPHRGQAVRDDQRGAAAAGHQLVQRALHQALVLGVQGGGGFV
mmetsp:Transcript_19450/g.48633  ORF Transcript_19450/g.48633 Transcript_19450/m.48633 type:complete len:229 (-) Transcript_19450:2146-2832(-)